MLYFMEIHLSLENYLIAFKLGSSVEIYYCLTLYETEENVYELLFLILPFQSTDDQII